MYLPSKPILDDLSINKKERKAEWVFPQKRFNENDDWQNKRRGF